MALIGFEHAIAEKNLWRKFMLSLGNRNEIIHCEFIFPNANLRLSSWQDKGVQFKPLSEINKREFLLFDLGSSVDAQIMDFFTLNNGKGYDKSALITDLILRMQWKNNDRFFCSEICYILLKYKLGLNLPERIPSQVSPQELYKMVQKTGIPQVYL
ncbi:hypothetical protein [Emticicia sp. BO119]|uniref:hypothetical protein n=1 Tax=Emticicia sp. BO119 TaxID=2757768 RepID=UPI0015F08452|nr:hypothetical protein [Emticicia sp. BO119]MBA4849490.1 hypothetical protein [Emticicia sp. BO119]